MARKARTEEAGAVHHVYARGNDRRTVFDDEVDCLTYLAVLGRVVRRFRWRCLSYCLMGNHLHLLVETPVPNLGRGMQQLQSRYAQLRNARRGGCGHVFQGRYGSVRIEDDVHLWTAVRYVARNPEEAGLGEDHEWSSHAAVLGEAPAPAWLDVARLLELLSGAGGEPLERYRRLVHDEDGVDLLRTLTHPSFHDVASALVARLRSGAPAQESGGQSARPRHVPRRARFGSVERAVLEVLELAARPLRVAEVHEEIELRLGGSIGYGSVKASLARLAGRPHAPVARVSRGEYVVREVGHSL